jgi:Fe2+ or Zn2+ uptake regulation protein
MRKNRETHQKRIIAEELKKIRTFFTTEDLLKKAQARDRKIGIATVYRFLKDRGGKDGIHSYYCDRRMVYSTQNNSHCHFTCIRCGRTTHFRIRKLDFLKRAVQGRMCHFQVDIHGLCSQCSAEE